MAVFDEVFHTDRIEMDKTAKPAALISIKPKSFSYNFMQYKDVFAGLQYLSVQYKIPWKIYYRTNSSFSLISMEILSFEKQKNVMGWAKKYDS